ncbi:hypothetical protein ACOSQ2_009446 [Xanthoceras sorbifolium]
MSALPVDLIVYLLCRIPVKSLLRFRCVSKQFRSIIDDPEFIRCYRQRWVLGSKTHCSRYIIGTPLRRFGFSR